VSNANSKVYKQISDDLQRQVSDLTRTLRETQAQKDSVVSTYSNQVQKNLDELKKAIKTIDIGKLARDSQYLDTIMNFDVDEDTKRGIKELKSETDNLITEVKEWRNDASKFDFLIVEDDEPKS
jgi:phage host-nuclease inhibitor protein Gam